MILCTAYGLLIYECTIESIEPKQSAVATTSNNAAEERKAKQRAEREND